MKPKRGVILYGGLALTVLFPLPTTSQQAAALSKEEARIIATEGFIYGLPSVMNYAVMYENAVDRNSGQFKAPFNEIHNEARVFTYKDTAVLTPNCDTPYSIVWMDLRAEPVVLSVPAVEKVRYYEVQLCDGNTFNYGYIGSRATGCSPRSVRAHALPRSQASHHRVLSWFIVVSLPEPRRASAVEYVVRSESLDFRFRAR